ncbi:hypothetical protein AB6809_29325 [Paraburkholderia sp. RCC_158]|uniref:hypothetical protein n=1 Tax=Paraburkholderia sp. RCC_158 TaxID=3239220 RepID=UPI003523CEB4
MSLKNHTTDTIGALVEQTYRSFHLALTGLVAESMSGAVPTSARAMNTFRLNSDQLEQSTLTAFANWLDSGLADASESAVNDAGAAGQVPEPLVADIVKTARATRAEVLGILSAALHKDCAVAAKRMRDFYLRVELMMVNEGCPYENAIRAVRIASQEKPLSFAVLDTRGRNWKPSVFAAATVRAALQTTYADAFVRIAAARGASRVQVSYPDPAHEGNGQILAISDGGVHPSYLSVRDEIFHPNSSALLAVAG